ncbi:M56 family metallopeptidase [Streptomyces sp. NBC_00687]|uniref:M56 family metallopeptidase n=1 Tax=Streptomyces sp. NBC_00687 TaxID=2975807 RepID=UPI00225A3D10|nr:M56 family metallopeptidase [Streptomyces sp. NBC_00687]MCX4920019.1 M56 family metallopeptidase [Streptomyces sp. NBC_00687]
MSAALVLLAYAAAVGFVGPAVLLKSRWPQRAPLLGAALWQAMNLAFCAAVMLAGYGLAMPSQHLHIVLVDLLRTCGVHSDSISAGSDRFAVAWPVMVLAALLACLGGRLAHTGRARARHRRALDLVGWRSPELGVTVLPYAVPAAYCLPGRRPRIVISDAALSRLGPAQLGAVLEHERAHIAGRHHLLVAAAEAFRLVFPGLPLTRSACQQTGLLLEMAADDRALRTSSREALAGAVVELAQARTPAGSLAASGPAAVIRMRRILSPQAAPHVLLRVGLVSAATAAPLLPLVVSCSGVG